MSKYKHAKDCFMRTSYLAVACSDKCKQLDGSKPTTSDPAISPDHYKGLGTFEAIDVIEAFQLNYRLGNVIKYVLRADKKGKAVQDLKKSLWYLTREISLREANAVRGRLGKD